MSLQSSTRTFMIYLVLGLALIVAGLVAWTQVKAREIAALYPPTGEMIDVGGYNLHAVHIPRPDTADLPPLVFIHGASGNLRDQLIPFRGKFEGRAELCCFIPEPPGARLVRPRRQRKQVPDGQRTPSHARCGPRE